MNDEDSMPSKRMVPEQANAFMPDPWEELYVAAKRAFEFLDNWEPGALGWTDAAEGLRDAIAKVDHKIDPSKCPSCGRDFPNGGTCQKGGCPMGGDF